MQTLTANELKTKGVSAVEKLLKQSDEVVISVRGQERYVMMDIEQYSKLREYELVAALQEAREDIAAGRFHGGSVAEHMQQVTDEL